MTQFYLLLSMIFLSAQPDDYYFLWQIQLQLYNFSRLGISRDRIHVLISFDKNKGLSHYFKELITGNNNALFYVYPDTRIDAKYPSSLRPHIIVKHYKAHNYLQTENIFYHDSDIIFNKLPDFNRLLNDEVWYASNTKYYTDTKYIKNTAGEAIFNKMCAIIGVEPLMVEYHDKDAGGAQYLLKKVSLAFWEKLEMDCEKMYSLLEEHNLKQVEGNSSNKWKIQAWCADMWCLWWAAIACGKSVKTDVELDFSWAHTRLEDKEENNIIHYTGDLPIENELFFRKNNYFYCSPFYDDFSLIDVNSSSYNVIKEIEGYNHKNRVDLPVLNNVTFFVMVFGDTEPDFEIGLITLKYLYYNVSTNLVVLVPGKFIGMEKVFRQNEIAYVIVEDESGFKKAMEDMKTEYGVLYPANFILSINQIINAIAVLKRSDIVVYNKKGFLGVDSLIISMFSKLLDISLLDSNQGKMVQSLFSVVNECVFFRNDMELINAVAQSYFTTSDLRLVLKSKISHSKVTQLDETIYYMICE